MDKTIRVYDSLDEMKVGEYRYWQSRPVQERMDAVVEITLATYAMKGETHDVPRLQRTLVHLQRPRRYVPHRGRLRRIVPRAAACHERYRSVDSARR